MNKKITSIKNTYDLKVVYTIPCHMMNSILGGILIDLRSGNREIRSRYNPFKFVEQDNKLNQNRIEALRIHNKTFRLNEKLILKGLAALSSKDQEKFFEIINCYDPFYGNILKNNGLLILEYAIYGDRFDRFAPLFSQEAI